MGRSGTHVDPSTKEFVDDMNYEQLELSNLGAAKPQSQAGAASSVTQ